VYCIWKRIWLKKCFACVCRCVVCEGVSSKCVPCVGVSCVGSNISKWEI
jgi:hypothetical protein